MDLTAEKILKNCKSLVSTRGDFDSLYETLQRFFFVDGDSITSTKNKGQERHHLLDATSLVSGNVLAAGLSNFLTPATSMPPVQQNCPSLSISVTIPSSIAADAVINLNTEPGS